MMCKLIWIHNKLVFIVHSSWATLKSAFLFSSHTLWSTFARQRVDIKGRNPHFPSCATDLNTHLKPSFAGHYYSDMNNSATEVKKKVKAQEEKSSCLSSQPPNFSIEKHSGFYSLCQNALSIRKYAWKMSMIKKNTPWKTHEKHHT